MMYEHKISQLISPDNWRGGTLHIEAEPGESAEQLMDRAAKIHEEWFKKTYGKPEYNSEYLQSKPGEIPTINRAEERLLIMIEEAPDKATLQGYYAEAAKATNPAVINAYLSRFKALNN